MTAARALNRRNLPGDRMAYDPLLATNMREAMLDRTGVAEKKFFGGYCWFLNGNMLAGVEVGRYMFRVGKELEPEALKKRGASPMDITGRKMGGIIWVEEKAAHQAGLASWIDFASRFVGELPAKTVALPRKKAAAKKTKTKKTRTPDKPA